MILKIRTACALLFFIAAAHFVTQYITIAFFEIMIQNGKPEDERQNPYPIAWDKTKDQYQLYYNKIKDWL